MMQVKAKEGTLPRRPQARHVKKKHLGGHNGAGKAFGVESKGFLYEYFSAA